MTIEASGPGYWFIYKMKLMFAINTVLFFATIGIIKLREFYIMGDGLLTVYESKVESYLKDKNVEVQPKEKAPRKKLITTKYSQTEETLEAAMKSPSK